MAESTDLPVAPGEADHDAPAAAAAEPPRWQERDAWTALDDLDVSPALVPACEWPAGLAAAGVTSGDRPGLYAWWVDEAGAADLTRGLAPGRDLTVAPGRIHLGQAGATKWPSGRANDDTLGRRIGEEFRPRQVLLFGSHARNAATEDSDVDVLVVMPLLNVCDPVKVLLV